MQLEENDRDYKAPEFEKLVQILTEFVNSKKNTDKWDAIFLQMQEGAATFNKPLSSLNKDGKCWKHVSDIQSLCTASNAQKKEDQEAPVIVTASEPKKETKKEVTFEDLNEDEKELYKLSDPICLTNVMVRRPCLVMAIGYGIMLAISVFVLYMGWLMPNELNDREYLIWGNEYVNDRDKTMLVKDAILTDSDEDVIPLQSQLMTDWTFFLIYEPVELGDPVGMWRKEVLIQLRDFE